MAVVAVYTIAIGAADVIRCGGQDSRSRSGEIAPDLDTHVAYDLEPAREEPPDAAYMILRNQGFVAFEASQFRTIVGDKYVGELTMAREDGGLWVYVDDRMTRYDGEIRPLLDAPTKLGAIAVDPDGTLWVSGEGLASYDGETWQKHALPWALRGSFVRSLVFAPDGARYGVADGVLVVGRGDTWVALTAGDPPVRDVAVAGDGTIYVSLRDQVARLAHDQLVLLATMKGAPPALVTAPDGTVHVFSLEGAHRISAGKLESLGTLPFTVRQVFGADGTLYGIPIDGMRIVRRRPDGAVDKLPAGRDLPFKAKSITVDTRSRLWLVLEHGMAIVERGQLTLLMPGEVPELPRDVEAIIVTGRGPSLRHLEALKQLARFTTAITSAEKLTLYEGLPGQREHAFEAERRSKPVQELHGYMFYRELLTPSAEDVKRLTQELSTSARFTPFYGPKLCGGFHPDYAVEWQQGSSLYRALLCFGCDEIKLYGPGIFKRYGLRDTRELKTLLTKYRKNRPPP